MTTSTRLTARITPDTQELLSRAAALMGVTSINSFVLSSAIEKANRIIEQEESIRLSREDALLFMEALDKPAKSHDKLSRAVQKYDHKTI